MEPKNKQFKNDGIDWISDLPDSILHKILSYVPTKNAVSTSILSTRWKNMFPIFVSPVMLDFDDSVLLHPRENVPDSVFSYFTKFVDKILNETLVDGPDVDSMILKCTNIYGDAKVTSWVSSALRLKLCELKLMVFLHDSRSLFESLCGCMTLVRLEICHKFVLCVAPGLTFRLPNVRELYLANLVFVDEDEELEGSVERLINGCPALEDLCIRSCDFQHVEHLYLELDVLKKLTILDSWNNSACHLEISTLNLETLIFSGCAAKKLYIHHCMSLLEAYVDVGPNQRVIDEFIEDGGVEEDILPYEEDINFLYHTGVANIIIACSSAVRLHVSAASLVALKLTRMVLPKFENLTWLSLGCIGREEWKVFAYFLQNAPNLEKLTLQEGFSEPNGAYEIFEVLVPQRPLCLSQKWKELDYWAFKEEDDEIQLLKYFLYQGQRLEMLKLHWLPDEDLGNLSELLKLPGNCVCYCTKIENGMQISIRHND